MERKLALRETIIGEKDMVIEEKEQALNKEKQRREAIEKVLAELRKKYEG